MTHILSNTDFDTKVLQSKKPVLVDFFATWCGPCQMLAPLIDELSHQVGEDQIFKIDVDQSPEIAGRYGVMSIPTLKVFKDGKVVEEAIGVRSKQDLLKMIEKHN